MLKVAAKLEEWNEQKYQEDFELEVTAEEGKQAKFDEECLDMLRLVTTATHTQRKCSHRELPIIRRCSGCDATTPQCQPP